MGLFGNSSKVGGVLAGLGRLTAPGSTAPSKDAKRVVASFVRGEVARGACKGKKGSRTCDITSSGKELKVGDLTLAKRPATGSGYVSVCVPDRGEMVKLKSGKSVEVQKSKDVRAAGGALLKALGTGLGVRTDKDGVRRLVGAHGKRAAEVPGQCVVVKLNASQRRLAMQSLEAEGNAYVASKGRYPTATQYEKARAKTLAEKREFSLKQARARSLAKRAAAAAVREDIQRIGKKGSKGWVKNYNSSKASKRFKRRSKK